MDNSLIVDSSITSILKWSMLKTHVGMVMFCPVCSRSMDAARAVEFDVMKNGELVKSYCLCATCADQRRTTFEKAVNDRPGMGYTLEINDGRLLRPGAGVEQEGPRPAPERNPIHAKDVKVGARYLISHTSGMVTVKVLGTKSKGFLYGNGGVHYRCLNEKTGREIVVKSAAKFRREITEVTG